MGVKPVKIFIVVAIVIISFLCLELLIPALLPIKCNYANTVNISAGHRFSNGSYKLENVIYDKRFYKDYDYIIENSEKITVEKHIRGCLCAIKSCIRICNNYVEGLDHINVLNEDEIEHKINLKNNTDYHIMIHRPCESMYELYEEDDEWIFHKNGSINLNHEKMVQTEHFCFFNETEADHITNVNICNDLDEDDDNDDNLNNTKWIVIMIGMFISFSFLLVTFFIYGWIPELHGNVHGKTMMSYIGSLMFMFIFMLLVQLDDTMYSESFYCKFIGYAIYYCDNLCLFWLNVMCYDIWSTFRGRMREKKKRADNKRFAIYFAYAFGSTTLLTLILFFVDEVFDVPKDFRPIIGIETCWVRNDRLVEFLYVYLPMSIISVVNTILYSMTAYKIYICQKELTSMRTEGFQKHSSVNADKDKFYLYIRLFVNMGLQWTMESVSWAFENYSYIFVFTNALNCLQGFIIFFLFVWKPNVIELIKKRWASS